METKFLVLLMLAVSMRFLRAEEKTGSEITTGSPSTVDYSERMKFWWNKLDIKRRELKKLLVRVHQLYDLLTDLQSPDSLNYPNITEAIYNDIEVKSLKVQLSKVWPKFWKVPRRNSCAKLFDEKAQLFAQEVKENLEKYYKNEVEAQQYRLSASFQALDYIDDHLYQDYGAHLRNCEVFKKDCDRKYLPMKFPKENFVRKNIQLVENEIDNFEDAVKSYLQITLDINIDKSLLSPVKSCLMN